jgi:hypothetical protein
MPESGGAAVVLVLAVVVVVDAAVVVGGEADGDDPHPVGTAAAMAKASAVLNTRRARLMSRIQLPQQGIEAFRADWHIGPGPRTWPLRPHRQHGWAV